MENAEETTVVPDGKFNLNIPFIVRSKNGEIAYIDKKKFVIGTDKGCADYIISENPSISRAHAEIHSTKDEFYIVDIGSTNHTYIDDKIIENDMEVKISHGEKIRLGNEEFEFRLF
jgi:pSer/pThr/pTyr-binding forkhead associated (FHA) protein